jgi:hypothetical protein
MRSLAATDRLLAPLVILLLGLTLSACGSDSSSSSATTGSTTTAKGSGGSQAPSDDRKSGGGGGGKQGDRGDEGGEGQETKEAAKAKPQEPEFTPRSHQDSAGGAAQFESKGGDNSIQEYGSEPSGSEFAAAAEVLHAYLDARAIGAWGAACERLAPRVSRELVGQLGAGQVGKEAACSEVLAGLTAAVPRAALREAAEADVGALRVEGESGFLLFRGAQGEDFFIPMVREDGGWKVAAIAASPLP